MRISRASWQTITMAITYLQQNCKYIQTHIVPYMAVKCDRTLAERAFDINKASYSFSLTQFVEKLFKLALEVPRFKSSPHNEMENLCTTKSNVIICTNNYKLLLKQ